MQTIQIPNDFSGKVEGRKCGGDFPDWQLEEINGLVLSGTFSGTNLDLKIPEICEDCKLQEVCTKYVTASILGDYIPTKEQFNDKSNSVYRQETLKDTTADITSLRECKGEYPWEKWEEWRIGKSDNFDVSSLCKECIFVISCAVQAARKFNPKIDEPVRDEQEFDIFSRERALRYLQTGQ